MCYPRVHANLPEIASRLPAEGTGHPAQAARSQ